MFLISCIIIFFKPCYVPEANRRGAGFISVCILFTEIYCVKNHPLSFSLLCLIHVTVGFFFSFFFKGHVVGVKVKGSGKGM